MIENGETTEAPEATAETARPLIAVVLGSTREERFGGVVADWFLGLAGGRHDLEVDLIDLRDFPLPFFDGPPPMRFGPPAAAREFAARVGPADGFVVVTPEYNYGPPAVLKNALDHLYEEWNKKPIAFVGYGGTGGAARAVQQLRLTSVELQMAPIRASVLIPFARSSFVDGRPREDLKERLEGQATRLLDQLLWWALALRAARLGH